MNYSRKSIYPCNRAIEAAYAWVIAPSADQCQCVFLTELIYSRKRDDVYLTDSLMDTIPPSSRKGHFGSGKKMVGVPCSKH